MKFNYNAHLTLKEKTKEVASDIINTYPNIPLKDAFLIASLENKINNKIIF